MSKSASKEAPLQAVVVVDNFDKKMLPLQKSMGLSNFAGFTFLDYALEFLCNTEAKEVFILTSRESEKVQDHVKKSWPKNELPFVLQVIKCVECRSFGDMMRDIDKKSLIKSDFILLRCGLISNCDLKTAIAEHRARRNKDKNCVITLIYSQSSPNNALKNHASNVLLALQSPSNKILHHKVISSEERDKDLKLPLDVFLNNDNVETRFDLLDCNLAVCSPQIPPLFSDNFDFDSRTDLIREILTNDEILGYSAHAHVLESKMASFVDDYWTYLENSFRVLERYSHPLVPDLLPGNGYPVYNRRKWNIYVPYDNSCKIAKTSVFRRNVLVGKNSKIDENVILDNCILGEGCVIGPNTVIKDCVLWNNVKIGAHCSINFSLICDNVILGDEISLKGRNIISSSADIGSKIVIEAGTVLGVKKAFINEDILGSALPSKSDIFSFNLKSPDNINQKLSPFWPQKPILNLSDDILFNDDMENDVIIINRSPMDDGDSPILTAASTSSKKTKSLLNAVGGDATSDDENLVGEDDEPDTDEENEDSFYHVVYDVLQRGFDEKIDCSNLILEINCAKPTFNVSVERFNNMLISAIIELALSRNISSLSTILKHFVPILKNYFKSDESQRHCLDSLENIAGRDKNLAQQLPNILHFAYDADVLDEEVIRKWSQKLDKTTFKYVENFVKWLEEADEESGED